MNAIDHHARPLTADERHATYADALSFYGKHERFLNVIRKISWSVGAFGIVCITSSAIGWTILLPLKSTEVRFIVDHAATGEMTYTVRADEAAQLFNTKNAQHYLKQYINVREGYIPELDHEHWLLVQAMSTPEVFLEYAAWIKSDLSPKKALGSSGHVKITNLAFTPRGKGDGDTYEYTIRWRRQEVRGDAEGPVRAFSTVVAFQWHPRANQPVAEGIDNPGGMLVVSYGTPGED